MSNSTISTVPLDKSGEKCYGNLQGNIEITRHVTDKRTKSKLQISAIIKKKTDQTLMECCSGK